MLECLAGEGGDGTVVGMVRRFETAIADVPELLALWDPVANAGTDPATVGSRSSYRRAWACPVAEDHRWQAGPSSVRKSLANGFNGCPCCAGRQLSVTNSFAARHPEGVALWHPTLNGDLTADQVLGGSPEPVWWKCAEGPDHEWQVSPLVLGNHSLSKGRRGCPFCAGKRPSVTNSVASHPQLSAEWRSAQNGDLTPDQVVAGTSKKLWWQCVDNPEHEWAASGANRLSGRGCPRCKKHLRSVLEVCLAFELAELVTGFDVTDGQTEATVVIDGVVRHVDMLLPGTTHDGPTDVLIEVDGRYRHAGKTEHDRDSKKTLLLNSAGYRVLRVREQPLEAISEHDVAVPTDATVKDTTDAVLLRLRALGWVQLVDIDDYLARTEPLRVDAAMALLRAERPGKSVRLPGPATFTRAGRWEEGLARLAAFVAREGHANVPWEHLEDGAPLGKWVGAKRAQYGRGRMAPERVTTLEALPGWTWNAVADEWEAGYQHLLAFHAREGHIDVPAHYWDDDGFPLGSWVRSHRKPGGRRTMTDAQRARLEAVPGWTFAQPTEAAWERAYAALQVFADREGHCRLPTQHRENDINIDSWAGRQRTLFHSGRLKHDRVQRLEAVPGWSWNPMDAAWDRGYDILAAHAARTGSAAVRRDLVIDGYPVGAWVGEQRTRLREGTLLDERRVRLEQLPGWIWHRHSDSWERHYDALLSFVDREGHAAVPTGHVEAGMPLSAWVIRHRQDHKAGKVPADRAARLDALPGWTWDVLATRWEQHYAALEAFIARVGHARVPSGHLEGDIKLGSWVIVQRQAHRKAALDDERAQRLERLPGWVWNARVPRK